MPTKFFKPRTLTLALGIALLTFGSVVSADPPSRVARLGYINGAVSFSPAGEDDWIQSSINRPLTTGDRLWADAGARAEIQVGGAMIRMSAGTGLSVLNLDNQITQLQLTQGTLGIRVRRLDANQVFEIDTPNLAFTVREPGDYRIEVEPDGSATTIVVRRGRGDVYGEGASYVIDSRQPYRFTGVGLREYEYVDMPRVDDFDRWANARDRSYETSVSARFVSQDVVGYQDLDANGTWRVDASYGNVWIPTRVAAGWAPYRDGHWAWVDPWGWTWVDDAPWGFAVSHYGRWANLSGTWGWVPGPVRSNAYYAPALVAFVGGNNFQLSISSGNVGGVAWFPLGPRDVYRPSYAVSRGYFENVNRSNTVINNTVINNYYNNNVTNVVYANQRVPGAVVAVPTTVFVQSQPVSRSMVRVSQEVVRAAPVAVMPAVAPTERSVRGASRAGDQPPQRTFERAVVARSAPPAAPVGFAAQQQQLAATPGQPLDDNARRQLKPARNAEAPVVRVVAPQQVAAPTALPPAAGPVGRQGDARGRMDDRKPNGPAPMATTPAPVSAPAAPAAIAAPPQPAAVQDQLGRQGDARGRADDRNKPTGSPPVAASPAPTPAPAPAAPAVIAAPPQPAAVQDQRGRSDQRGNNGQRGQASAPPVPAGMPAPTAPRQADAPRPVAPPQAVAPAPVPRPAPAAVAPPAPVAAPAVQRGSPEQRGNSDQRGNGQQQRGQSAAPSSPQPQRAPETRAVAPQPVPPAAVPAPQAQPARSPQPVATPNAAPPAPTQQPAARAPRGNDQQPGGGKPDDRKKDADELKREDDRKPKG